MDFLDMLDGETLLLIPSGMKNKILKYIRSHNSFLNVKIMSIEEVKKKLIFDYDVEAILYLMNKYGYRYEVAKILIENIYFIEDTEYKDSKLRELVGLKKELLDCSVLKEDKLFINKYKDLKIKVFGYDYITKYDEVVLNYFTDVEIIKKDKVHIADREVYKFKNINDEVAFVMKKIMDLIYEGIDINNIKIANLNDDYRKFFKRYSRLYNIPIFLNENLSIYGTKIVQSYLNHLLTGMAFSDVLAKVEEEYNLANDSNRELFNRLVNISNKYVGFDYDISLIIEAVKYDLKHVYVKKVHYDFEIEEVDIKNNNFDDEYIFFLGFNQGDIPFIHKDEDYISDSIKSEVKLNYVSDLNKLEKEALTNFLITHKNIFITYKLMSGDVECYPSNLVEELGFKVKSLEIDNSYTYSDQLSELELAIMMDNLIKYGIKNKDFELYFSNYKVPYLEYDNKFNGIDADKLIKHLKNELSLSYSSIDNYYKCGFKYYISNILKIGTYEESFVQFVGNLYHYILECFNKEGFDFEKEYAFYVQKRECSAMEEFFLLKLKEELLIILDMVRAFHSQTELVSLLSEERIAIDKMVGTTKVTFKGFIDKILYKEIDGETLVAIVDYKTGDPDLNLFNVVYGLDTQLLTYIYLLYKKKLFSNVKVVGFYLQKILNKEVKIDKSKTYLELKRDNLKMEGYSIDDMHLVSLIDSTYEDSEYIQGMKVTSKGEFGANVKVISEDIIKSLIELLDKKIDEARDEILKGKFLINPKRIDSVNVGCKFCSYNDICYKTEKDIVNLKSYKDFSFLGGE